jgi:hypothetical protein
MTGYRVAYAAGYLVGLALCALPVACAIHLVLAAVR